MKCTKHIGFTLIELITAVAIIGILAAIAIPAYTSYIDQANRSDAKATLLEAVQILERNFTEANRYDLTTDGVTAPTLPGNSPQSGTPLYNITTPVLAQTTYTLLATRVPGNRQGNDACGDFSINQFGVKAVANATLGADVCWRK